MKTNKNEQPLYGQIPLLGGEWHVFYAAQGSSVNICRSGYGPFPFDRFDIPVIDLSLSESVCGFTEIAPPVERGLSIGGGLNVNQYLDAVGRAGYTIINRGKS